MRSLYLSPQSCKSPHWWCSPRSTQTRSRTASRDEWLPNTTNNRRQSRRASNCCNRATRAAVSTASRTTTSSLQRFRTAVSSKEQRERSKVVASSTSSASSFFDCVFVSNRSLSTIQVASSMMTPSSPTRTRKSASVRWTSSTRRTDVRRRSPSWLKPTQSRSTLRSAVCSRLKRWSSYCPVCYPSRSVSSTTWSKRRTSCSFCQPLERVR